MNNRRSGPFKRLGLLASIPVIVLVAAFFVPQKAYAIQDYIGAQACKECHEDKYNAWRASSHPYSLMTGESARSHPLPVPKGYIWDDISYVIGGQRWQALYFDRDGYLITNAFDEEGNTLPGHNQYNLLTGEWSDSHPGDIVPFTCGACHTTGWIADNNAEYDGDLGDNQDGLPGLHGTWVFDGVQCEACHGPGTTMEVRDSAAFCGKCHVRGDSGAIAASDGFIDHNAQYNEFRASPMSFLRCVSCHDPHKKADLSIKKSCESCHEDEADSFAMDPMSRLGVECIDCHMPYATRSAQALGPHQGDVRTHLFAINTDADASMFTPDGNFVALNGNHKGAVTLDFVCQRCHQDTPVAELAKFAKNFHDQPKLLDNIGLNPGLSGSWRNSARDGEGFLVDVGYSNGVATLVASFYTYDSNGNQVWLLATGPATSGTTTNVSVVITNGPAFGDNYDPEAVQRTPWGTGSFTFTTCSSGSFSLTPNQAMRDRGFTDIGYPLARDLLQPGIKCPVLPPH